MQMRVTGRHPSGRPLSGALQIEGTQSGYPIVLGIPRLTRELALRYANWLEMLDLTPPDPPPMPAGQTLNTVESFGFEWSWDNEPRTEEDLFWRVASRHELTPGAFRGHFVLDAGCGAGDQSRWLLDRAGASRVVSVDLSQAIAVTYQKLENNPNWLGIQGDLSGLPFGEPVFTFTYCEGVLANTQDSRAAVRQLLRVLRPGGWIVATHLSLPVSFAGRLAHWLRSVLRSRLSRLDHTTLLFVTGCLAAGAHIPLFGRLWGRGMINPRMPQFKATWSNTYDYYGSHAFQRHISASEFASYFLVDHNIKIVRQHGTEILARKLA